MTKYESVLAFHKAFQLDAPDRPTMPGDDLLHLRWKLTKEENEEKFDSRYFKNPLARYLDAVADLLYVVHGDAVAAGITEAQLDRAFREVHESNMSKMWSYRELVDQVDEFHKTHYFEPSKLPVKDSEKVWVVKNKIGKVIKSPSYKPVDLSWIEKEAQ